jgi:hypothetical protein
MFYKRLLWLAFAVASAISTNLVAGVPISLVSQITLPDSIYFTGTIDLVDVNNDGYKELRIINSSQVVVYSLRDQQVIDFLRVQGNSDRLRYVSGYFDGDTHIDLVELLIDSATLPQHILAVKWLSGDGYSGKDTVHLFDATFGSARVFGGAIVPDTSVTIRPEVCGSFYYTTIQCDPLGYWCDTIKHSTTFLFDPVTNDLDSAARFPTSSTEGYKFSGLSARTLIAFTSHSSYYHSTPAGGNIYRNSWFSFDEYLRDSAILTENFYSENPCSLVGNGEQDNWVSLTARWIGDVVKDVSGSELLLAVSSYSQVWGLVPDCYHCSARIECYNLPAPGSMQLLWSDSGGPAASAKALFSDSKDPAHFYSYTADSSGVNFRFFKFDSHTGLAVDSSDKMSSLGGWQGYVQRQTDADSYACFKSGQTLKFYSLDFPTGVNDSVGGALPRSFRLQRPYPNPFNATVTVPVTIGRSEKITVDVLNVQGQAVARLYEGVPKRGELQLQWQAGGNASGVYLVRLSGSGQTETAKVILLK